MDANGNIIPIVEGDQGEGFMDEVALEKIDELEQDAERLRSMQKGRNFLNKGKIH